MSEKTTLEWSYTPTDFFEEPFEFEGEGYKIEIHAGRAVATLLPATPENEPRFQKIHADLNALFLGAQPVSDEPYELQRYRVVRFRPDGTQEISVSSTISAGASVSADLQLMDAAGNIIRDTRVERIRAKQKWAQRAAKHQNDSVAAAILRSYNNAVNDPANELVHLYEIRDALSEKFGGDSPARNALSIASGDWSRLGYLANEAPLRQGRHAGKKIRQLRDATPSELSEARKIARKMIRAYLEHL